MWAVLLGPPRPSHNLLIPKAPTAPFCKPLVSSISATAKPPQSEGATPTHQVGNLGRTLLTTIQSNSSAVNSAPKRQEQNRRNQEEEEDEESQITGSDILWALQKASAHRKKKQKKRVSSSAGSRREEGPVDYSNVRPLNVKGEWGAKLDELEKRLQELSETI